MNWYTSDMHFGHENILKLCNRPFDSVEQMNNTIVRRWNTRVRSDDNVYVLGDVAMGKIDESLKYIEQLNGNKFLVPGNHDRCWYGNKKVKPIDIERYTNVGFTILDDKVPGPFDSIMSHFPYAGDSHDEDRFKDHRPNDNGQWLLHGHVHDKWRYCGRQINVGVDVWDFYPISERTIASIMDQYKMNIKGLI